MVIFECFIYPDKSFVVNLHKIYLNMLYQAVVLPTDKWILSHHSWPLGNTSLLSALIHWWEIFWVTVRLGRFFGIPKKIGFFSKLVFRSRRKSKTEKPEKIRETGKNTKNRGRKDANIANLKSANSSWLILPSIIPNGRNQSNVSLVRVFIFRFSLGLHFETRSYFKPYFSPHKN